MKHGAAMRRRLGGWVELAAVAAHGATRRGARADRADRAHEEPIDGASRAPQTILSRGHSVIPTSNTAPILLVPNSTPLVGIL